MIIGSDNQNKNLVKAASKKIDTSSRTRTSNAYAAKIATSKTSSKSESSTGDMTVSSRPQNSSEQSDVMKGSYEGLVNQSSTLIQMDGQGYDNPGFQYARYKRKSTDPSDLRRLSRNSIKNKLSNTQLSFNKSDIINNYSSIESGNSVSNRMREYLMTNNMFR